MIKRILVLSVWLCCFHAFASVKVDGSFYALQQCPAFLSKNNQTNPDERMLVSGETYPLIEINRQSNPDWYRIKIDDATNPLRWVSHDCGQAQYDIQEQAVCNHAAGHADSYVLALSWQPAFCETYGYEAGKAECKDLRANSYAQKHLVLHGLWPNQDACGHRYGFCGVRARSNHCDYQPVDLRADVSEALKRLMPSFASGTCLERHEWQKHGSCQLNSSSDYFNQAMELAVQMDDMPFVSMLRQYRGGRVALSKLEQSLEQSFGKGASKKIYLGCSQGKLVDMYIQLPLNIEDHSSLIQLVADAREHGQRKGCPAMVSISDFSAKA